MVAALYMVDILVQLVYLGRVWSGEQLQNTGSICHSPAAIHRRQLQKKREQRRCKSKVGLPYGECRVSGAGQPIPG